MGGDPDDPSLARTSLERVAAVAFLPVPPNAWMGVWVPADFLMRCRAFGAGMTPRGEAVPARIRSLGSLVEACGSAERSDLAPSRRRRAFGTMEEVKFVPAWRSALLQEVAAVVEAGDAAEGGADAVAL
jgi:hypothetical protein